MNDEAVLTPEQETKRNSFVAAKAGLGFWIYLMTDLVLFAALFATYAVLRNNTYGGPGGPQLFNLPYVLVETLILLTSSFTAGLVTIFVTRANKKMALVFLAVTFALGVSFVAMELTEFSHLISEGNSYTRSGFLSAFFTLVGTHGLHISIGLLWMVVMGYKLITKGLTTKTVRQITLLSMFWHFLDIVWIFIFSIVYMIGVL
jgi:cytochrome o ubiquinol oxidase subunit III